jgi:hypothetical protein
MGCTNRVLLEMATDLSYIHTFSFFRFKHLTSKCILKSLMSGRPTIMARAHAHTHTHTQQENQTIIDAQAYSKLTYTYKY